MRENMSSYYLQAKNKKTGEIKTFMAIDDFYGKHRYGYKDEDGTTYNEDGFDLLFEIIPPTTTN